MKQFFNIKLRGEDSALSSFPPDIEKIYNSTKAHKEIQNDIYKKMASNCVFNYSVPDDKKAKKNNFEIISSTLSEAEKKVSDDLIVKETMLHSINTLDSLGRQTKEFDKKLSQNVIHYFQDSYEDASLSNLKKVLATVNREMKSREEKLQQIQDQIINASSSMMSIVTSGGGGDGVNSSGGGDKLAAAMLAEEHSEKEVEMKKDLFLTKLFAQDSQRIVFNEKMLEFFELYLEYFSNCQKMLNDAIPEMKKSIDRSKENFVFNLNMEKHIESLGDGSKLSFILETCISELDNEDTLKQEGLFRVSGSKGKIDLLESALNIRYNKRHITEGCDAAVYASLLKQYLRQLPEPLMTSELYENWSELSKLCRQSIENAEIRQQIQENLKKMPKCYYDNLVYLMQFLRKIADNEAYNKMSSSNLSLMFGPNLIRPGISNQQSQTTKYVDGSTSISAESAKNFTMVSASGNHLIEFMINEYYLIFPDAPVYKTKPSPSVNDTDNSSLNGNHVEDSVSSGYNSLQQPALSYNKKDAALRASSYLRKAPAPPPPLSGPSIMKQDESLVSGSMNMEKKSPPVQHVPIEAPLAEDDTVVQSSSVPVVSRNTGSNQQAPQIKKRFSRLDKPSTVTVMTPSISPRNDDSDNSFGSLGRAGSKQALPNLPSTKPKTDGSVAPVQVPKRPVYPPPPVPQSTGGNPVVPAPRKSLHQYSKSSSDFTPF